MRVPAGDEKRDTERPNSSVEQNGGEQRLVGKNRAVEMRTESNRILPGGQRVDARPQPQPLTSDTSRVHRSFHTREMYESNRSEKCERPTQIASPFA